MVPMREIHREDWDGIDGWMQAVQDVLATLGLKPVGKEGAGGAVTASVWKGELHTRHTHACIPAYVCFRVACGLGLHACSSGVCMED